jgi:ribonuclease HI
MSPWLVFCDGSAVPNPGRIGLGAVFTEPDGTRHTLSQAAHEQGCNNEAELRALLVTLQELKLRGARTLIIHCDEARALFQSFDQARLVWIPHHRNGEADALARAALGIMEKRVVKISKKKR